MEDYKYRPCAGGLSPVNVIDMQLRDDLINSSLARWRLKVHRVNADAGSGKNPTRKQQIKPGCVE